MGRPAAVRLASCLMVIGGLAAGAADARASSTLTVGAKGGLDNLVNISATFDGFGNQPENMLAGTLTGSLNGGPTFDTYCVDLYHVVMINGNNGTSSYVVNPLPIASLPGGNGAGVGYLYDQFAPTIANEAGAAARSVDGAALQVAIWKVEYDNGGPLTSGHFEMTDSNDPNSAQHQVFARATQYLSAYDGGQSGDATWFQAVSHPVVDGTPTNQNMIGVPCDNTPHPPPVPTPEPMTLATAGLGAAALLVYARRARKLTPVADGGSDPLT